MSQEFIPINVGPANLTITFGEDVMAIQQRQLKKETLCDNSEKEGLIWFYGQEILEFSRKS